MRNMSFAMTTHQVLARSKDVTRRMGWLFLSEGDQFQPVKKGMGLRPGEKIEKLGGPVTVVNYSRVMLRMMTEHPDYGRAECIREGFPDLTPAEFVAMFCKTHKGCTPDSIVTRIEFAYGVPPSKEGKL